MVVVLILSPARGRTVTESGGIATHRQSTLRPQATFEGATADLRQNDESAWQSTVHWQPTLPYSVPLPTNQVAVL